ncbi:general stress protein [Rhizobium sp. PL01]|uniref:general stress protein n=1 Tax=Rhizobium sp. PL01 TaxID=3085631 RepID=UPI0029823F42|nr:general stress protein [Rhizobium sp. PL01]MDW5316881.1 general stress protein [Rhizobium sp. PL01]
MKTVTGLFDDYSDASTAVRALEARGIPSDDISIVSNNADGRYKDGDHETNAAEGAGTGAGIGAVVGGAGGLLTGLGIMAIPGVGPVVAAGWLAATALGAVGGAVAGGAAGGLIGAMTASGVPEDHAHVYAEGVRRGGTLVTAKVEDHLQPEAEAILKQSNWVDPDERRTAYSQQGWTNFDETAEPFGPAEIEQERGRYPRRTL